MKQSSDTGSDTAVDVEGEKDFSLCFPYCVEQMQEMCVLLGLYSVAFATHWKSCIFKTTCLSAVPSREEGNEHAQWKGRKIPNKMKLPLTK